MTLEDISLAQYGVAVNSGQLCPFTEWSFTRLLSSANITTCSLRSEGAVNPNPHRTPPSCLPQAIAHIMKMRSPEERFALLNVTIATLPSMHVRGFKNTATNIVDHYRAQEDCMDQKMRNMVRERDQNLRDTMSLIFF